MENMHNIQILLETMTRCGGNCSGCALASIERMTKTELDFTKFLSQQQKIYNHLSQYKFSNIESISLFLGQGDHFLMQDEEIEKFVKVCASLVPEDLKHKTVVFITASAIGKHSTIRYKMDLFYQYSLQYQIPFFIQVVFDPKKMLVTDNFKEVYMKNILYFKEKCGMTELTINLGEDLYHSISPQEFHEWIITHNFKHVEMNWVLNKETHLMWKKSASTMFSWLQDWLLSYKNEPLYEINFIPFLQRSFLHKELDFFSTKTHISQALKENLYIDSMDNLMVCQMGLISNITPIGERLVNNTNTLDNLEEIATQESSNILKKLLKKPHCLSCEYKNICANSGITSWFEYKQNQETLCPWGIKDFLEFFEMHFVHNVGSLGGTRFHKNPVQDTSIIKENNATSLYFHAQ